MKKVLQILSYIKLYWGYASLNILFNILSVIFSLFSLTMIIPFLGILFDKTKLVVEKPEFSLSTKNLFENFNYYISQIIISEGQVKALGYISMLVVLFFFLKNFFRYFAMFFLAPVRMGVVRDIRNAIYGKILILPLAYFNEQRKGDVMSRFSNDVMEIEWSVMSSLEMLFREPINILIFLTTLFFISPTLTGFALVLLPITGIIIVQIGKSLRRTSSKGQTKMGVILSILEETISGLRIIKAFSAINVTDKKFRENNLQLMNIMVRLFRKRDLASPLSEFLSTMVLVVILYFGGRMVISNSLALDPTFFIYYMVVFSQLILPAKNFTDAFYNVQKGIAATERVNHILDADELIIEKPDALPLKQFNTEITYHKVFFSYNNSEFVLSDINFKIQKGKSIALVGASGGGKSTFVDLLPRFYDTSSGSILIDDIDIKEYKIDDLRSLMGIVTQETILFNDTVFNNIAFGLKDVDHDHVVQAAKIANAHEFISQMPEGYQTNIGDRGLKLSGGQRQRLSIARAVLRNPPILILDEATSALDTESERLVQDALEKVMKSRTSIVIAHRLSTIQNADEIIVLDKGRIVEKGKHSALLTGNGIYKRLIDMQSFK